MPNAVWLSEEKAIPTSAKVQLGRGHDIHGRHEGARAGDTFTDSGVQVAPRADRRLSKSVLEASTDLYFPSGRLTILLKSTDIV